MTRRPVDTVVFDLGNVLVGWDPRHLYRRHFGEDVVAMEAFLATVCTPAFNDQIDAGRPFADAVDELVGRFPDHEALIRRYHTDWEQMLAGPIDGSVEILAALRRRGVPRYALSNWSAETFPIARDRYDFFEWFDGILLSADVGVTKPDPAIFEHLGRRFGLAPAHTVFVDDNPVNVDAARALGFDGIVFTDPPALRAHLAERGLL